MPIRNAVMLQCTSRILQMLPSIRKFLKSGNDPTLFINHFPHLLHPHLGGDGDHERAARVVALAVDLRSVFIVSVQIGLYNDVNCGHFLVFVAGGDVSVRNSGFIGFAAVGVCLLRRRVVVWLPFCLEI